MGSVLSGSVDLPRLKPVSKIGKRERVSINPQEAANYPESRVERQNHRDAETL